MFATEPTYRSMGGFQNLVKAMCGERGQIADAAFLVLICAIREIQFWNAGEIEFTEVYLSYVLEAMDSQRVRENVRLLSNILLL